MTSNDDFERRLSDHYVNEPPPRAPVWVLEAARLTIDTTPQRRPIFGLPWRFFDMNGFAKFAVAAVAVIAIGAVGWGLFGPGRTGIGGPVSTPSPSPSASAAASPSPGASYPPLTGSFTSNMFGISLAYPTGWSAEPAQVPWDSEILSDCEPACIDQISESGIDNSFLRIYSEPLAGASGDAWIDEILSDPVWGDTCAPTIEPVTIDGFAGRIAVHCPDPMLNAVVTVGGRGYLLVFFGTPDVDWFKQVLATVQLSPQDAVDALASPSP